MLCGTVGKAQPRVLPLAAVLPDPLPHPCDLTLAPPPVRLTTVGSFGNHEHLSLSSGSAPI